MRKEITDLDAYLEKLHSGHSSALAAIEKSLREDGKWGINIGLVEGLIIQWLIKSHRVVRILEIGTQYGYSTQWMLDALPAHGEIITLEKNPLHHAKASSLISDSRVQFLLGDAKEILPTLADQPPFDFVFIDANKKSYPDYLFWAEKYLKSGGLLLGDNTLLFGEVFKETPDEKTPFELWKSMRQFNQAVFANKNFVPCFIPTTEGLTLACKV